MPRNVVVVTLDLFIYPFCACASPSSHGEVSVFVSSPWVGGKVLSKIFSKSSGSMHSNSHQEIRREGGGLERQREEGVYGNTWIFLELLEEQRR